MLLICLLSSAAAPPLPRAPLLIADGQRQLFIDVALVGTSEGTVLRMHAPIKGEVVITADRAWEGVIFYYDSIVQVSNTEFRSGASGTTE